MNGRIHKLTRELVTLESLLKSRPILRTHKVIHMKLRGTTLDKFSAHTRWCLQKYWRQWRKTGQTPQKESCASMHTGQTDIDTVPFSVSKWTTQNLLGVIGQLLSYLLCRTQTQTLMWLFCEVIQYKQLHFHFQENIFVTLKKKCTHKSGKREDGRSIEHQRGYLQCRESSR